MKTSNRSIILNRLSFIFLLFNALSESNLGAIASLIALQVSGNWSFGQCCWTRFEITLLINHFEELWLDLLSELIDYDINRYQIQQQRQDTEILKAYAASCWGFSFFFPPALKEGAGNIPFSCLAVKLVS